MSCSLHVERTLGKQLLAQQAALQEVTAADFSSPESPYASGDN